MLILQTDRRLQPAHGIVRRLSDKRAVIGFQRKSDMYGTYRHPYLRIVDQNSKAVWCIGMYLPITRDQVEIPVDTRQLDTALLYSRSRR